MDATTGVPVWHTSALVRMVWGVTLTAIPRRVLGRLGRPSGLAVGTLRVLGLRHLIQAAATVRRPTPMLLTAGAAADGLHASTAVALAVVDRRQRRIALLDTVIAGGWMALDLRAVRHSRQWTGRRAMQRSRRPGRRSPNGRWSTWARLPRAGRG